MTTNAMNEGTFFYVHLPQWLIQDIQDLKMGGGVGADS